MMFPVDLGAISPMKMVLCRNRMRVVALCGALLAGHVRAETYRDATHGWSIDLPAGWVAGSASAVKALDDHAASMYAGRKPFTYVAGFSKSRDAIQVPPYVIVQFTPTDFTGATREDLERAFQAIGPDDLSKRTSDQAPDWFRDQMGKSKLGTAILDPSNRVLMTFEIPGPPAILGRQVGLVAKDGLVQMSWYDFAEKPAGTPQEFDALAASFRLDPDRVWTPAAGGGGGVLSGALRGAIIGAGIGVVLTVVRVFAKRRKGASA